MGLLDIFLKKDLRNYELISKVDEGEMSTIYKARNQRDGKIVCLKILKPSAVRLRQAILSRFPETNDVLLSTWHENIVRTLEFGRDGMKHFITIEYLPGILLISIAKRKLASLSRLVGYFVQIAAGLKYLHEGSRLIHRDFNPYNVVVNEQDICKIIDLDFAFPVADDTSGIFRRSGTLGYLAPEQVRGKNLDVRVDIYAFGASLYETITGYNPYRDTAAPSKELRREKTLTNHLSVVPISPSSINAEVPRTLDALVLRCLEIDPHRRPQAMAEVEDALKEISSSLK